MNWYETLRDIREKRKLTTREVARQMAGRIGHFSPSYISQIETGKRKPNMFILEQILQVYGLSFQEFVDHFTKPSDIKAVRILPVIDMTKATFDDIWNADGKVFRAVVVKEEIGAGGIRDSRTFALEVMTPELADCGTQPGDYLIISPRTKPSSGEIGLILIRDDKEILVRRIFQRADNLIRLVSENPTREERVIDRAKQEVKIYFIDSIQKKQRRSRRR